MFEPVRHPSVTSSHPGVGMGREGVVVVFTDLVPPEQDGFDEAAYRDLERAVSAYLDEHPDFAHATIVHGRRHA